MTGGSIPEDVAELLLNRIDSIGQLEALLLLRRSPDVEWTSGALSQRLYIAEPEAANLLARLAADGFLLTGGAKPVVYQYRAHSGELAALVDRIAELYRTHLIPITNLIHNKPRMRIQQFADAFKLKKKES